MERYQVTNVCNVPTIELTLKNMETGELKISKISVGDLLSVLYIDKLVNVGNKKEYVIRGRISSIKEEPRRRCICTEGSFSMPVYHISIDASHDCESKIYIIQSQNILDVNELDYCYYLDEDREVIPIVEIGVKLQNIDPNNKSKILQEEQLAAPKVGGSYVDI